MDMDEDAVTDPTAEFGELFEGQTVAFESELGGSGDDVLGTIGHDLNIVGPSTHHQIRTSHHPSDHEILSASLSFVPDDYLQHHQHIVIDNENGSEYMVPISEVGQLEGSEAQPVYIDAGNLQEQQPLQVQMDVDGTAIPFEFVSASAVPGEMSQQSSVDESIPAPAENPKVKKKVKVVKDVEYFTKDNIEKYLSRRGFKYKGSEAGTRTISKTVLALSANTQLSNGHSKLVSHESLYDPDSVVPEMERFWKFYVWTKSRNQLMSMELLPTLIPMLLHFYYEMMMANMLAVARRICLEFSKKFLHEDKTQEHYDILVAVMKITSPEMLRMDTNLTALASRRYEITFSELTIMQLRRFLSQSSQPVLVSFFSDRFKIRSRETKELFESINWDMLDADESEDDCSDCDEAESTRERNNYVDEIIGKLRNSVTANLPAISVYTTPNNPVCGAVSKRGSLMAFGLAEAGIRICSVENAKDIIKSSQNHQSDSSGITSVAGHAGTVYGVHFHPKTKLMFSVGEDSFMRVWDLNEESPRCRAVYRGHVGPVWKLDIPDSGSLIATAGLDTTARIFLPERTEFVRIMAGHYYSVNTVKFHPNEAYLATGSTDKSARLWSVADGNMARVLTGLSGSVSALAFHNSGRYLAGAGEDNKIMIWDLAEGEPLACLDSLPYCTDLTFSGSQLAACYRCGKLQVYNLRPIIGGSDQVYGEIGSLPSIESPFTTTCFAKSLFRLHFKDPGMLFCLGSDLTGPRNLKRAQDIVSEGENQRSSRQEANNVTLLHQVVQSRTTTDDGGSSTVLGGSAAPGNSAGVGGSGRILATRLSQPLSSVGDDEGSTVDGPLSVGTIGSVATPLTLDPSLVHKSPLDAGLPGVIDQEPRSTGVGGTITMYASS